MQSGRMSGAERPSGSVKKNAPGRNRESPAWSAGVFAVVVGVALATVTGPVATAGAKPATATTTPTLAATATATRTATATPTRAATATATLRATPTAAPATASSTPTNSPTSIPTATATSTPTPLVLTPTSTPALSSPLEAGNQVLVRPNGGRVDWRPGTGVIAFSVVDNTAQTSEIYQMSQDGSGQVCLTCTMTQIPHLSNDQPAWHRSGSWLLFQSADPSLAIPTLPAGVTNWQYIQGGYGYNNNLWVMRPDGSVAYQLTHITSGSASLHPHFSPDGTKVFWSSFVPVAAGGPGWVLQLADFDTSGAAPALANVRTLAPFGSGGTQVYEAHDMTPDNGTVLYSYSPTSTLDLDVYSTNVATGQTVNLTSAPGVWDEHGHFSADGKRIAWVSSRGYPFTPTTNWQQTLRTDIWLMNADGSNMQQVTSFNVPGGTDYIGDRYIAADLAWSSDGSRLVFAQSDSSAAGTVTQVVRLDFTQGQ